MNHTFQQLQSFYKKTGKKFLGFLLFLYKKVKRRNILLVILRVAKNLSLKFHTLLSRFFSTLRRKGSSNSTFFRQGSQVILRLFKLTSKKLRINFFADSRHAIAIILAVILVSGMSMYLLMPPKSTTAGWLDEGWHFRRKLTIDNASSSENLTNFPILVSLNSSRIDYDNTQNSGEDLRFTDPDGVILSHEIESWNESGTSTVWVKIPQIDAQSIIDHIYVYYGNPDASDAQDMENVWDSNFKMVQHLQEASTSTDAYLDSTSNNYDGTATSTYTAANLDVTGKIDGANDFDGSNDNVQVGDIISELNKITVEAWAKLDTNASDSAVVGKWDTNTQVLLYDDINPGGWRFLVYDSNNTTRISGNGNSGVTGTWVYVVGTYDKDGSIILYENGVETNRDSTAPAGYAVDNVAGNIYIGTSDDITKDFDGTIDEVRISNTARSAEWIEAQYKSMTDDFITFGSEEKAPGPVLLWRLDEGSGATAYDDSNYDNNGTLGWNNEWASWSYRKKITIDNTKVATTSQTDFPVLVNLTTDISLSTNAQDDGDDIVFTASDGKSKFDHEIESYASSTGALVAWVRIPYLAHDADTEIYMYYGNSGASDQQNVEGVWDSNYKMVQHMDEDPDAGGAGDILDSTSNNNDGTATTSMTSADLVSAQIGDGIDFDGDGDYIAIDAVTNDMSESTGTYEFWVYRTFANTVGVSQDVINAKDSNDTDNQIKFWYKQLGDVWNFTWKGGGTADAVSFAADTIPINTWTNIGMTWDDNANELKAYINGAQASSTVTITGTWDGTMDIATIGATDTTSNYSAGHIDEVRISDSVRTDEWIATSYNNQNSPATFYALGSEEKNNNWITGKYGKGLDFSSDYRIKASDANSLDMGTSDWSISTWIKTDATSSQTILTKGIANDRGDSWYSADWDYRKKLTFDNLDSSENLANFPVLVQLTPSNFSYNNASSTGADIRFADSDGTTLLDYEIESWTDDATSTVWVEVPQINATSSEDYIYMYYGNAAASDAASSSAVWDSDYVMVHHFVGATSTDIDDSTSNNNDVISQAGSPTYNVTALISSGITVSDGTSDQLYFSPSVFGADISGASQITVEGWFNPTVFEGGGYQNTLIRANIDSTSDGIYLNVNGTNNRLAMGGRSVVTDGFQQFNGTIATTTEGWIYHVGILDIPNDTIKTYKNGGNAISGSVTFGNTTYTNGSGTAAAMAQNLNATVDEIRVSKVERSAEWIEAQYKSMTDDFITFGDEEGSGYDLELLANGKLRASIQFASTTITVDSSNTINNNEWRHIETTFDRDGNLVIYVDGKNRGSVSISSLSSADISSASAFYVATDINEENYFNGSLDDIRIYNYLRTEDQVEMDYEGNLGTSLPIQFGSGTAGTTNWGLDAWSNRTKITIDADQVATTTQTDFPVLINTTNSNWKYTDYEGKVGQADGGDIVFTMADGATRLKHEIESYVSSTGAVVAWVKIPSLSATTDTDIYMYYGNATCANQEDPENVWDSNFKMVQHMNDETTATTTDSTSNNNDGTKWAANKPIETNGKIHKAQHFYENSTTSFITIPDANFDFVTADALTLEAWVYLDASQYRVDVGIMGDYGGGAYGSMMWLYSTDEFNYDIDATFGATGGTALPATTWKHLAMTWDSTNIITYIDGVQDRIDTQATITDGADFYIASYADGRIFDGIIDEVRVSYSVRSVNWITTTYNNQNSPSTFYSIGAEEDVSHTLGIPVAYYRFDGGAGSIAYDDYTNSNDLAIAGASWTESGKYGNALSFDGTDDYLSITDSSSLSPVSDISLSAWVKLTATGTEQTILGKWDETTANNDRSYRLWIDSSNKVNFTVSTDGSATTTHVGDTTLTTDTWYHVGGIYYASTSMDVYVGGLGDANQKTSGVPASIDDNASNFYIGAKENTSGTDDTLFNGIIDEVRIYNYARTAVEMRVDYNRGMAVNIGEGDISGGVSGVGGNWWNDNWHKRIKLTIDNASSTETLANFPMLVSLNSSRIAYVDTQDSGQDIRFTNNHGVELKYEIESWNESGTSTVWVKIPSMTAESTSKYIYMYYDNPSASDAQDAENVWDSNFKMVQHMDEDPDAGGAGDIEDSTSNNNNGTATTSMTTDDLVSAQIGDGIDFDGSDDYIEISRDSSIEPTSALTIFAWVNLSNKSPSTYHEIVSKQKDDWSEAYYSYELRINDDTTTDRLEFYFSDGTDRDAIIASNGSFVYDQWTHIAVTFDSGSLKLYQNGAEVNATSSSVTSLGYWDTPLDIGKPYNSGVVTNAWTDGIIDEVRISNTARSAEWIEANYLSMTDDMLTYASAEKSPEAVLHMRFDQNQGGTIYDDSNYDNDGSLPYVSSAWLEGWNKRIEITVNDTYFESNQTHFPLPLLINSSSGTGDVDIATPIFSELGDEKLKIAITESDGISEIYGEVAWWDYDSGTVADSEGVVWVSEENLEFTASGDVTLYIYYDSGEDDNTDHVNVPGTGNAELVWASYFAGVYHLNDGNVTTVIDSTINSNDGTKVGSNEPAQDTTNYQISGASQSFDGMNDIIDIDTIVGELDESHGSVHLWMRRTFADDVSAQQRVFYLLAQIGDDSVNLIYRSGTDLWRWRYEGSGNADYLEENDTDIPQNIWTHVVGVWDESGDDTISFFVDGAETSNSPVGALAVMDSSFISADIGATYDGSDPYTGQLQEFWTTNDAKDANWSESCNQAQRDAVISWGSEEINTYSGDWISGKYGNALDFDGSNDYILVSNATSTSITGDLSISAWIRPDAISSEQTILGKWDETTANNDRSYRLYLDVSNKLNFSVSATGTTVITHTGTNTTFSAGNWYHVEAIYDNAGTMDLYVNGKLDVTQKSSSVPASVDNNTSNLYIGAKENTSGNIDTYFNGAIDDVRIYNYARTASQVLVDYNGGFSTWLGE